MRSWPQPTSYILDKIAEVASLLTTIFRCRQSRRSDITALALADRTVTGVTLLEWQCHGPDGYAKVFPGHPGSGSQFA